MLSALLQIRKYECQQCQYEHTKGHQVFKIKWFLVHQHHLPFYVRIEVSHPATRLLHNSFYYNTLCVFKFFFHSYPTLKCQRHIFLCPIQSILHQISDLPCAVAKIIRTVQKLNKRDLPVLRNCQYRCALVALTRFSSALRAKTAYVGGGCEFHSPSGIGECFLHAGMTLHSPIPEYGVDCNLFSSHSLSAISLFSPPAAPA